MKTVHVIGARPQFVKYFAVAQAEAGCTAPGGQPTADVLVHTGQHYDYNMSKVFFDELGIKEPDYHLGVGSGTHGEQTALVLRKTEELLGKERPDALVVYGDTNSTLGAALAAAKMGLPVAHIEAGLRSFNRRMPEEINRVLTDHVSSALFCPSLAAVDNLHKEGFPEPFGGSGLLDLEALGDGALPPSATADAPLVVNSGDVMYDVIVHAVAVAARRPGVFESLRLEPGSYTLLTLHRAENTDDPQRLASLVRFVNEWAGPSVVFPMHPRMRKAYERSPERFGEAVRVIDPLGYFDLLMLMKQAARVMTDSGGMQKEAFWLEVPCVTLRDETEWVETVQTGWNILYRDYQGWHRPLADRGYPYGDGKAAERIVRTLTRVFGREPDR